MTPAKLDTKRSYGQIFGHKSATYEQDGRLFTGSGTLVEEKTRQENQTPKNPDPVTKQISTAMTKEQAFLINMLNDTAVAKSVIVQEATKAELSWSDVQQAAFDLGVVAYKQGKSKNEVWKLSDD